MAKRVGSKQDPAVIIQLFQDVRQHKGLSVVKKNTKTGGFSLQALVCLNGQTYKRVLEPGLDAVQAALAWQSQVRSGAVPERAKGKPRGMYPVRYRWLLDAAADALPGQCVLWPFAQDGKGFGMLARLNHRERCHTLVGRMYHDHAEVFAQTCGNRLCVNPHHIVGMSRSEFQQYAWVAARQAIAKGLRISSPIT